MDAAQRSASTQMGARFTRKTVPELVDHVHAQICYVDLLIERPRLWTDRSPSRTANAPPHRSCPAACSAARHAPVRPRCAPRNKHGRIRAQLPIDDHRFPRTRRHSYSRPGSLRKYSTVRATPSSKGTSGVHPSTRSAFS